MSQGQNVAIDYRWGNDQSDRLAGLAADLIRRQAAVDYREMFWQRARSWSQLQRFRSSSLAVAIRLEYGLVTSLNQPGGNITGVVFHLF